jgi:hypothetical protein
LRERDRCANGDVDGLTGNEINYDDNNAPQQVHRLTTTNFISDPGHGWTDVAGALPGTTLSSTAPPHQLSADRLANLTSNGGFVRNFQYQERSETALPPHDQADINPGLVHTIEFRPQQAGTLGARALPLLIPTQSQSGLLGRLSLRTPASSTPVATQTAPIGSGAISVSHTVTAAELALFGNWTCEARPTSRGRGIRSRTRSSWSRVRASCRARQSAARRRASGPRFRTWRKTTSGRERRLGKKVGPDRSSAAPSS